MPLHLPRMDGFGATPYVKNGPPLAGHGAKAVRDAIATQIATLPEQLRRSLTWDQGAEMAQHAQLKIDTGGRGLLLRPSLPVAAPQQREHQRPAAPVLPQGHRPVPLERGRPRRRRRGPERQTTQDTRLAHSAEVYHEQLAVLTQAGFPTTDLEQIRPSIGSVGDVYDNALMETINLLYKVECIRTMVFHDEPYKALADGESRTSTPTTLLSTKAATA